MKKKQLNIYSGKLSELDKVATPEQVALGISNAITHAEPFLMTDVAEIYAATGYNDFGNYRTGISNPKLVIDEVEYASYEELKNFIRYSAGVRIVPSDADIVSASADLDAGQTRFVWSSNTKNLTFNLQASNVVADDMNTYRQFTYMITNATPAGSGPTTHGYITVRLYDTVIDIIPRGTTRIYSYGAHNNNPTVFSSPLMDRNLYTKIESFTTASNYVIDPSVALVYDLGYTLTADSVVTVQTTNLSMSFDTFTVIMRNMSATNKLTLAIPTGNYADKRTYEILAGKCIEASVVKRGLNTYWQVSGVSSNA